MNFPVEREEHIRSWMLKAIHSDGVERFSDLHLDSIDPVWKDRGHWLDGGLVSLRIALTLRDINRLPVDIALVFSLVAATDPLGVNFSDAASFQRELDWSPPSLYVLKKGVMPWSQGAPAKAEVASEVSTKSIDPGMFGALAASLKGFFMEFKTPDSIEYSRTVHLIG